MTMADTIQAVASNMKYLLLLFLSIAPLALGIQAIIKPLAQKINKKAGTDSLKAGNIDIKH